MKTWACRAVLALFALGAAAQPASTFRNLSPEDAAALAAGGVVFRQPDGWKDLSVPAVAPFYKDIEDTVRKGGHNYIGEVLLVLPAASADALIPELQKRLADVEHYAGIPYWSRRQETFYDLFDWVRATGGRRTALSASITALQYMKPFGEYESRYEWEFRPDSLYFSGVNTSDLSYDGIKAVKPGNMIWRFHAYKSGSHWVFYGLGAVKAFDMFGLLRDRLSASFMGRIEAFFKHAYGISVKRD